MMVEAVCRRLPMAAIVLGLVAVTLGMDGITVAQDATKQPNILLIMADDLGWSDLHCQGNDALQSPVLDALAERGIRFTNGYAAAPVCTPTRAALMTGLAPARLDITNHAPGNPDHVSKTTGYKGAPWTTYLGLERVTVAERLKNVGYKTGFIGKWHLSHRADRQAEPKEPQLRPEFQGFELNVGGCSYGGPPSYFEPYRIPAIQPRRKGDYLPDRLAEEAIEFVKSVPQQQPFFLCWWNYSVHYPIQAPESLIEKHKKIGKAKDPAYAAMIDGMDRSIGRLLDFLESESYVDDTLVIFTSDNGSLFDNLPLRMNKGHLYEGGIRVPWIISWPGQIEAGRVSDVPVITMDLVPTMLRIAGAEYQPDEFDGVDLMPVLKGTAGLEREALYFHYPNYAFHKRNRLGCAIRFGNFKLIRWFDGKASELYDLQQDPEEKTDLAAEMPSLAKQLEEKLSGWLAETKANLPIKVR